MTYTLTISLEQHRRFADLSGDHNPLHTDPVLARRLMHGGVVVHGVHTLLRAMDLVAAKEDVGQSLSFVQARFLAPVPPESRITFDIGSDGEGAWQIATRSDLTKLADFRVGFSKKRAGSFGPSIPSVVETETDPDLVVPEEIATFSGLTELTCHTGLAEELFPRLTKALPVSQIATLLATTRVVGMRCPGLNSVFSELELNFESQEEDGPYLEYSVKSFDDRFGLVELVVQGAGAKGTLRALLRPEPQRQPPITRLRETVAPHEFVGQRSLVVGGSRGLGELAAKLLVVGGADVLLTYNSGEIDAQRVADEIASAGGRADTAHYDVTTGPSGLMARLEDWEPSRLLYFASPPIFHPRHEGFSEKLFDMFASVYLTGFVDLFHELIRHGEITYALYPSTVAVTELPRDLFEYAVAKAAGENACAHLQRRFPHVDIRVPRFPRVPTDQTASTLQIPNEDPVPILLESLRSPTDV